MSEEVGRLPRGQAPDVGPSRPGRSVSIFLVVFAAAGLAISAWTIATPLMAAPDEPYHVVQAAALVRGQFDRPYHRIHPGLVSTVRVPYWVQTATVDVNCIAFNPKVSASCQPPVSDETKLVGSLTSFSHSPPLYYALDRAAVSFRCRGEGHLCHATGGGSCQRRLDRPGFLPVVALPPASVDAGRGPGGVSPDGAVLVECRQLQRNGDGGGICSLVWWAVPGGTNPGAPGARLVDCVGIRHPHPVQADQPGVRGRACSGARLLRRVAQDQRATSRPVGAAGGCRGRDSRRDRRYLRWR